MYKVAVIGHFAKGKDYLDGQTVKTKILTEELAELLGSEQLIAVDTHGWEKTPWLLMLKCFNSILKCENVIILPAHNGVKILLPLFLLINRVFNRRLHYVVIGGWLPDLLSRNRKLKNKASKLHGIYVETNNMLESLKKLGLNNVIYLPNFKRLDILEENQLEYADEEPYKLCTFSRVMREKGIEDAIDAVTHINRMLGRNAYILDIYGQVDEKYEERFAELKNNFPDYIAYKGTVKYSDSVAVLKDYFALLFPTYYEGEGFAGTILDAYASGIPVIATNWRYNAEIIRDGSDGLLYDCKSNDNLIAILNGLYQNPNIIFKMKINCLARARQYSPEIIIGNFIKYLQ